MSARLPAPRARGCAARLTASSPLASAGVALLLLLGSLLPAPSANAEGVAVEGEDFVRALPPAGARVAAYENAGYRLMTENGEVRIEVQTDPIYSRSRYRPAGDAADEEDREPDEVVGRLARALASGAHTEYEAASRIFGWIARNIEYRLDRELPQSAEAVLERRSGYCTGVARLAVALLRSAGVEAREVAGYVVGDESFGQPHGYHRWVETYLSDVGWVFSDPLYSHHYVPATYLRLDSEKLDLDRGVHGLLLERQESVAPVDLYPPGTRGIRARRNDERRLAASLRVAVESESSGVAVLESSSKRWRHALVAGETTFVGLAPGDYRLAVIVAGATLQRELTVVGRQRRTLLLDAAAISSRSAPSQPSRPPRATPAERAAVR
ncbi:MAG: transglutaminase-like domain-containing protein [Acidobacteriota bacterium]